MRCLGCQPFQSGKECWGVSQDYDSSVGSKCSVDVVIRHTMPRTFIYDLAVNNPTSNKKSQLCLTEHIHRIEFSGRPSFSLYSILGTGGTHREHTHRYTNMNMTSSLTKDFSHLSVADKKAPPKGLSAELPVWADCCQDQLVIFLMIIIDQDITPGRNLCQLSGNAVICLHFFIILPMETKAYSTWSRRPVREWTIDWDNVTEGVERRFVQESSKIRNVGRALSSTVESRKIDDCITWRDGHSNGHWSTTCGVEVANGGNTSKGSFFCDYMTINCTYNYAYTMKLWLGMFIIIH